MTEPEVITSEILVTVVTPVMTPDWHIFALRLKRMDYERDLWGVERHHQYLGTDGEWSWRNDYDDEWRATHYLPLEEATALAKKYAPMIGVNGHVAQRVADQFWKELEEAKAG